MKGVIFDMDGTMFDTQAFYDQAWADCTAELGQTVSQAFLDEIRGCGGPRMMEIIHKHIPGIKPEELERRCVARVLEREQTEVPLKNGLFPLLDWLSTQDLRLAVASSSVRKMVEHNLAFTGTDRYFDYVIAGDQVSKAKPDPEVFLTTAQKLGLRPEECYVIEDSANGILAAHRAGCTPILVPDLGKPSEETLALCGGVYEDLLQVRDALQKEFEMTSGTGDRTSDAGTGIIIRSASEADAADFLAIYAPYVEQTAISFEYTAPSEEEFRERIRSTLQKFPWLVIEEDGVVRGYAYAGVLKGRAAYARSCEVSIYVDRHAKGHGYGRLLYEALEQALRERGILNLYACIADPETEDEYLTRNSEHFHQHLGYQKTGTFHKCAFKFGHWYNMIWMEKFIGEHK